MIGQTNKQTPKQKLQLYIYLYIDTLGKAGF